jgi:ribose 5-phosphate isomerase B
MRISVGSDHRGVHVRSKVVDLLKRLGHEVVDEGTGSGQVVDYPDIASIVCRKVSSGQVDRGILVCGTGIGMVIAANKFRNVRAAVCYDEITAEISRRHNDANVLCLSGDMLGEHPVDKLVSIWLQAEFEGGRHARRIAKISQIEREAGRCEQDPPEGRQQRPGCGGNLS